MTGLKDKGMVVWVEPNDDPKRKLNYAWKLVELPDGHWAGIDTNLPNTLVAEALGAGQIAELTDYQTLRREVKYGVNSRIDFLLTSQGRRDCYVEVKAATFQRQQGLAEFPDSVTERGTKHLGELINMIGEGHRAVMLYVVHRTDCARFKIAADVDPKYAALFDQARAAGVEMLSYDCILSEKGERIRQMVKVDRERQKLG
jgi:sugar fermentation stimulation protein A